ETSEKVVEPEVEPEAVDISTIKGVGEATEEKLRSAGYDTLAKIVGAESFELALKTGLSEKQVAKIIESAKEL
ncbi:helix-hairpin-helix domain-containing protein, partial [Candidatus Bathyarchaeota archaeon]|nr:helix-hairpin-helix domain-containing protein [Candidatus Bathyarchaeota archaeon]